MEQNIHKKRVAIIGGGAAGFFTAANLDGDKYEIALFERAKNVLQKVKIAGGGRCNVTHACFDPKVLVNYYPRGHKELRGVFTKFQPGDTMTWFEERGLRLKIEADNRIFPVTDSSQSVINVLMEAALAQGTVIKTKEGVQEIKRRNQEWEISTKNKTYTADKIVFCTGSSPKAYQMLRKLQLPVVDLVPSLFTFNIQHQILDGLMGTSFPEAVVEIPALGTRESGALLMTHWGLSGPAVLKLSAWCARDLQALNYQFEIGVNFIGMNQEAALQHFEEYKQQQTRKSVGNAKIFDVSRRFWHRILEMNHIDPSLQLANLPKKHQRTIVQNLCDFQFKVNGKSTFKEEFVTAGGVDLKEIDFKTMQSKTLPDFYLAGEVLDIDAVTGGFNFQACWSEAWLIARDLNAEK